jgi:hypothetical protein
MPRDGRIYDSTARVTIEQGKSFGDTSVPPKEEPLHLTVMPGSPEPVSGVVRVAVPSEADLWLGVDQTG